MLGGAGGQLALLVLGCVGLGAGVDQAPAEQAFLVLAQIKLQNYSRAAKSADFTQISLFSDFAQQIIYLNFELPCMPLLVFFL